MELKMRKPLLVFIIAVLVQLFTLGDARTAAAMNDAVFIAMFSDSDRDGISDYSENALLAKYSPYYLFSRQGTKLPGSGFPGITLPVGGMEEHYNPTDAIWYARSSVLVPDIAAILDIPQWALSNPPRTILESETDLTLTPRRGFFAFLPLETIGGNSNYPGRHGQDWGTILAKGNVGIYGHVVPSLQPKDIPALPDITAFGPGNFLEYFQRLKYYDEYFRMEPHAGKVLYKIEYWQFFGYNNADKIASVADHEGDWDTVQLLYDPENKEVVRVTHYVHGDPIFFSLKTATSRIPTSQPWGQYEEFRGKNFGGSFDQADLSAWHNTLRMHEDPWTHEFTHPVVYVEYPESVTPRSACAAKLLI